MLGNGGALTRLAALSKTPTLQNPEASDLEGLWFYVQLYQLYVVLLQNAQCLNASMPSGGSGSCSVGTARPCGAALLRPWQPTARSVSRTQRLKRLRRLRALGFHKTAWAQSRIKASPL